MKFEMDAHGLQAYVLAQLSALFPFPGEENAMRTELEGAICAAMKWVEECFPRIRVKYFWSGSEPCFSPLIGDQYAMFLYMLARTVHEQRPGSPLAARLYLLNKALHGLDLFYEIRLPRTFLLVHPVGTVLGRAVYGERLVVYQGVTVGANTASEYPEIGADNVLFSNASVIGRARLGAGVQVAARCCVMDAHVPAGHVVFNGPQGVQFRPAKKDVSRMYFVA